LIYRIFSILAIVAVIVGSIYLGRALGPDSTPPPAEARPDELGYSARDAEVVETGDDGRALYTLNAGRIQQTASTGLVKMMVVRMRLRDSENKEWKLSAEEGQMPQDASKVELFGDVRVAGLLPGTDQDAEIRTRLLSFDTRQEIVSTHAPVTLSFSGRELKANGLVASLKDRRVKLESSVHAIFNQ